MRGHSIRICVAHHYFRCHVPVMLALVRRCVVYQMMVSHFPMDSVVCLMSRYLEVVVLVPTMILMIVRLVCQIGPVAVHLAASLVVSGMSVESVGAAAVLS